MIAAASAIFRRDLKIAMRVGGGASIGLVFFLCVVTITPFGVGPDMALLARIGPAILWIGALLATLLGLDRLFQHDVDDGSLDLLIAGPAPLSVVVAAKIAAHWVATGLPLVVAAPVLGLLLNVPPAAMPAMMATLLVGTPGLAAVGAIGAALAVSLRRGGLLMAVLALPLAIPILIFGVSATMAAVVGPAPFGPSFALLAAFSLIAFALAPVAAAAALRSGLE